MNGLIVLTALLIIIVLIISIFWYSKNGNESNDDIGQSVSPIKESFFSTNKKALGQRGLQSRITETEIPKETINIHSGTLEDKLLLVFQELPNLDKHFLYLNIVMESYKLRKNKVLRELCKLMSERHISEFQSLKKSLRAEFEDLPQVPTFQHYATILTEDGEFEKAIQVCKAAMDFKLKDGTKSGYSGRIERIERKRIMSAKQQK